MRKFFASLRRLLALERAHISLGAAAQDAISKIILPRLQYEANAERSPEEKERIEALIREYAEYADPRNPKSRIWAEKANTNFNENIRRTGISPAVAEDIAQDMASDLYTLKSHQPTFHKFDPFRGPAQLISFWNGFLHAQTLSRFREKTERERARFQQPTEEDDDIFRTIPSTRRDDKMDELTYREVSRDLADYVHSRAKGYGHAGQYIPQVFDKWLEVAETKGGDRVNMSKDVYEPVMREMARRGEDVPSRTMISEAWPVVKKMVVRFFESELDMRVSDKMKEKLRMSSEVVVATEMFRRKLARWILGL